MSEPIDIEQLETPRTVEFLVGARARANNHSYYNDNPYPLATASRRDWQSGWSAMDRHIQAFYKQTYTPGLQVPP